MPRNMDDGEDFEAEINAVPNDSETDGSDNEDSGSDLYQLRMVLAVPVPDAQMHDALTTAQQAYHATWSELRVLKRQYLTLSSAIPAHSHNRVLKKMSSLDSSSDVTAQLTTFVKNGHYSSITQQGQKYALFSHFWVVTGLFPTTPQPVDVNPRSAAHWSSPNAKLKGAMTELYQIIPKDLHTSMETYSRFGTLFCAAVSSERSNILHSIKDCAGVIFSPFKLDPSIFANQPSTKQDNDNKDLLMLLKRNGEGNYICLAPVLFTKPNAMSADDFLKSQVLVKIIRVEVFGKAILGGKTRGHPKGRSLRMDAQSVSEETKIDYQKDLDFYLEHLYKSSPWAISVMEFFNREVFNTSMALSSAPTSIVPSASIPRTWEDDLLEELDNPVARTPSPALPVSRASSPTQLSALSAAPATIQDDHIVVSTSMSISQSHAVASASTQLQVDVSQLSLTGHESSTAPTAPASQKVSRWGHISAQPAQVPMDSISSAAPEVLPPVSKPKRVSGRSRKPTTR
ncbi:hypothetical protein F4604DRAFT_1935685 [Suillus subluteus]|nr:hypothetical protein F4604DRAFT_1935685 [Suillus subluteus]